MSRSVSLFLLLIACLGLVPASLFARGAAEDSTPLRIGLMADFTALPFLAAEQEGLFAREGLSVEFSVFRSAVERDAALQAGRLDGCNADIIAAIALLRSGFPVRVVASAANRFSLVANPGLSALSGDRAPVELMAANRKLSVGISRNTVIEYVLDSVMAARGVAAYEKLDVARIPVRLELLLNGQLDAALLPLPFDELAFAAGCKPLGDSLSQGLDPDLYLFTASSLAERRSEYRALWRAVDAARLLIEKSPDRYRPLLSSRLGFNEAQARQLAFPAFPPYVPTGSAEIARASAWMLERGLIQTAVREDELVQKGILP